jgi:hypothetical protein
MQAHPADSPKHSSQFGDHWSPRNVRLVSTTIAKSRLQKFTERRCIPEVMTAIESFYNSVALRSECIMPGMMHGADF